MGTPPRLEERPLWRTTAGPPSGAPRGGRVPGGQPLDSSGMLEANVTGAEPRNVPELFLERVGLTPDAAAFSHPAADGGWRTLTWEETERRVRAVASGLKALGFAAGEVGAILASTRLEWILADFGILFAGGATTTIYPSSTAEDCGYILADSRAVVAFAENPEQVAKLSAR